MNGGSALDAVEKGVRVTESDLTNRSVGIGPRFSLWCSWVFGRNCTSHFCCA
jgi:hypothetical protein